MQKVRVKPTVHTVSIHKNLLNIPLSNRLPLTLKDRLPSDYHLLMNKSTKTNFKISDHSKQESLVHRMSYLLM